ncbi:MAG: hypothetical protein J0L82_10065 [Deltaproteobacteria bacterium]|nr:hypothetical protein [Deltaproteobacteria bacterium]
MNNDSATELRDNRALKLDLHLVVRCTKSPDAVAELIKQIPSDRKPFTVIIDEFIIHPNVVKSLGVGECVVVSKYPRKRSMLLKVRKNAEPLLRTIGKT